MFEYQLVVTSMASKCTKSVLDTLPDVEIMGRCMIVYSTKYKVISDIIRHYHKTRILHKK